MTDRPREGDPSPTQTRPTVLLMVDHDRNRRLLADQLSEDFAVLDPPEGSLDQAGFDLCLVDERSLANRLDELQALKTAEDPAFLPFLLLVTDRSSPLISNVLGDGIDDVIEMPVGRAALRARVENLLERRRLSVSLRHQQKRSEEQFRSLFEAAPDPVMITTPDGEITEVNDAFVRAFDVDRAESVGNKLSDLGFTTEEEVNRILLQVTDEDSWTGKGTVEWESPGGDRVIAELNTEAIGELGTVTDRIGIFRDLTEFHEHQERLRRQNDRLERFASFLTHDLRNPLEAAYGEVQLATQECDSEHLEGIREMLDRMDDLVDDARTLAMQGQTVIDPDPVDLLAVGEEVWETTTTGEMTLVTSDAQCEIRADESRLRQLLENVFRNAREHAGENVTVRVGCLDGGFYVADDGPGIPDDIAADVFEAGVSTAEGGTGLGLAIVREIADAHGWHPTITSSGTDGTRIEFRT